MNYSNKLQLDWCFSLQFHFLCPDFQPSAGPLQILAMSLSITPVPCEFVERHQLKWLLENSWINAPLLCLESQPFHLKGRKQTCMSNMSSESCHEFILKSKTTCCMKSKSEHRAPCRACRLGRHWECLPRSSLWMCQSVRQKIGGTAGRALGTEIAASVTELQHPDLCKEITKLAAGPKMTQR